MMKRSPSLMNRRRRCLRRLETQRRNLAEQYHGLVGSTRAWAASPRSLVQAFLLGILTDQTLAFMRYQVLAASLIRPFSGLMQAVVRANKLS